VRLIAEGLYALTWLFLVLLLLRVVISWIRAFSRTWRPRGLVLVLAEGIYTITDPPVKLIRKIVPSIQLGMVRIDLSVLILSIVCLFALSLIGALANSLQ